MIDNYKNIHFIGIGGAGMMPLAIHCRKLGMAVTGSDLRENSFPQLRKAGISPVCGHNPLPDELDLVIYSAAVKEDNCELKEARENDLVCMKRAEFLGLLTKDSEAILVAGSHGKSTTSVMLSDVMHNHPSFRASALIGAESISIGSNYYDGETKYFIVEADEYDRSFLKMYPSDLIVLNIDNDHLDIYGDIEGVIAAFRELCQKLDNSSLLVYNGDDNNVLKAVDSLPCLRVSFGIGDSCKYRAVNICYRNFTTSFDLLVNNEFVSQIKFLGTGSHYLYNLLSVLAMSLEKGITVTEFKDLILNFKGLKRRQEIIFEDDNYCLIDDYAHHSTEIKSSLKSVRENCSGRIVVIFQPHLYSRTKHQYRDFAESFENADLVLISHIYPAREAYDPEISSDMIWQAMTDENREKTKVFADFDSLYRTLLDTILPGDVLVSLGAGEINELLYRYRDEVINGG